MEGGSDGGGGGGRLTMKELDEIRERELTARRPVLELL